ncbi:DUF3426 domain-containing protein [Pseudodesulfovibrio sediminis]|uniref:Zinc finger/thioredoxin putative domain-containing protein n=1 Tax=Pseudodesulfovibrio sediminis TaxID=2810563 RepID=A0ABN6ETK7_9BACT|nr:DUF3426 domain-containing protein [Pseudodesulfovibrio sediminis]BCS88815.1 hypothetical protein PSDVSF_20570 [Pseudodesulfovibrio sediminis]
MIVTCPNCETRYNLPDDKVPAGGAKVKCSKCSQIFKAEHPPAPPEEEFDALLEEEAKGGDVPAGDEFDDAFEDVAAAVAADDGAAEVSEDDAFEQAAAAQKNAEEDDFDAAGDDAEDDLFADEDEAKTDAASDDLGDDFASDPADEVVEEDMADMDDLFDDTDETPDADEGAKPSDSDVEDDSMFEGADDDESDADDLFGDDDDEDEDSDDDAGGLFDEDDEDDEADEADEAEASDDSDMDSSLFEEGDDLTLDDKPEKGSGKKSLGCLIIIVVVALALGAAIYFKAWTLMGLDLADTLKDVPFVGQMFMEETGGDEAAAPGELPADRVRKIELKNVKQYYVPNEKVGNLFVVEGKAVNTFPTPKEQIKVEVILYDKDGKVLTSKAFLCGNVLSQFQLQVQTEKEIEDGLASEVGILSNNTFVRSGAATPFMAVFFDPPTGVKEFVVKVVDVGDAD